jgi:hypothetical protein
VKTCAFRLETIHDDAAVCRYCTRPCLVGAAKVLLLGPAVVLGEMKDGSYAVRSVVFGGEPKGRFDGSKKGYK